MRTKILTTLLTVALVPCAAHAAFLPTLNTDALLFASESVVEGPIVAVHARDYNLSAQVRVERTWAGHNFSGQTLRVGNLGLYSKRLSQNRIGDLSRGDRVIFFLQQVPVELMSSPQDKLWPLDSGVRLVRGGRVVGFTQRSNPGGYDELPGVPRAVFEAGFAASVRRVAWLKARLKAPARLEDAAFFETWNARFKSNSWGFGGIYSVVNARLAQIHKLKRLQSRN